MEPYQQRVIDEKKELDDKLSKLDSFTRTEKFNQLPDEDQALMSRQAGVMKRYSNILQQRIDRF